MKSFLPSSKRILAGSAVLWLALAALGAPVKVELRHTAAGWQLLRAGQTFFVKGAGGSGRLDLLAASGANSLRTWGGNEDLLPLLDAAQTNGLTVTVGIWLHHENDTEHFSYDNPAMLQQQLDVVRQTVLRYKDHPAVLMWGIGNEMEGYQAGDKTAIWQHVNAAARLAKELDPNHPVMTVVAEIGGQRIPCINQFCPDVDIVGINAYGGAASIATRYAALNPQKPYLMTEFGPPGTWKVGRTAWNAPIEPTSLEKAASYRHAYVAAIDHQPWCVGSYAFLWGHKQEVTATWFGMFLADGSKVNAVDVMTELWSGQPAKKTCPEIHQLALDGGNDFAPGETFRVQVHASDPAGEVLRLRWVVQPEQIKTGTGGQEEPTLPELPACIVNSDAQQCLISAPHDAGGYRVFAYASNGAGASVANVPFHVHLPAAPAAADRAATLPFYIYENQAGAANHFTPSGWMGKTSAIKLNPAWTDKPHSAPTCIQCQFASDSEWGGVIWQDPAEDWGERAGGWNLTGAKKLVFWARGEQGGEVVSFKFGVLGHEKKFCDSGSGSLETVTLTPEWKAYAIDLTGQDLARIKTGFGWSVAAPGRPVTFYLDDIRFE